jgi:hypothetical protein
VRAALISLQVFLLMCTPLPQASYAAVAFGRSAGLGMALLFALYAVSDVVVFTLTHALVRRAGRPGLLRLRGVLPSRLARPLNRAIGETSPERHGWSGLAALCAAGYANLYLAALLAGLGRRRVLPAAAAAISGDLVQFSGAIALAGVLLRVLPVPGGEWAALLTAPLIVAALPAMPRAYRVAICHLRSPRPSFLPIFPIVPAPAPALVPVRADESIRPRQRD